VKRLSGPFTPALRLPLSARGLRLSIARGAGARLAGDRVAAHRRAPLLGRHAELLQLQAANLVAQAPGLLELQVGGGLAHAAFELLDIAAQIVADHVRRSSIDRDRDLVALADMRDDVADVAADRGRRECRAPDCRPAASRAAAPSRSSPAPSSR
jgi:hypothetical protein